MKFKTIYINYFVNKIINSIWANFMPIKNNMKELLPTKIIRKYNKTRNTNKVKLLCHAPFTNIYFGYDGKMGVCCYNRTHIIGEYPFEKIYQAWNGDSVTDLRNKIKNYDLSSGCYLCQVQLIEGAFHTVLAKNYDGFSPNHGYPRNMEFELSNQCNLKCIMCSEENSSSIAKEKNGHQVNQNPYNEDFIEELKEFIPHLKSAKFLGGEPFLIPIYYKIWEVIIELNPNCEIIVQTNGTILNEKIKKLLQKGNFSLSISIDSVHKKTYESIRIGANFEEVYSNLLFFIEFCKKNNRFIGIASCFMQQNWKDIPDLIRFVNTYQIPITFNRVWYPPQCSIWESSYELTSQILNFFKNQTFSTKTIIEQKNYNAFNDLIHITTQWNNQEKIKFDNNYNAKKTSVPELEIMVKNHILNSNSLNHFTKEQIDIIISKFNNGLDDYNNHPNYRKLLLKIIEIPPEIMQRELLNNSDERIKQQIREILEK